MKYRTYLTMFVVAALIAGCGKNDRVTRKYTERRAVAASPQASMPVQAPVAAPQAGHSAEQLAWDSPAGWTEKKGSGMRLATLTPGPDGVVCTIVALGAASGSVEMNIQRWAGQLGLGGDGFDMAAFIAGAEKVATAHHNHEGEVYDFSPYIKEASAECMIAGRFPLHGRMIFVKLTGSADSLKALKPAFMGLCASLRMVSGDDA